MDIFTMEPMVPEEASHALEDEAFTLTAKANQLAGRVHPILRSSIGDLVRSMNCYYSNLIEGHDTHPRDIDRALANDFAEEPKRRELQQEAVAHVHVQQLIDSGQDPDIWPARRERRPGFAHSAALGHREPLPVSVGDYAVLERFMIAQPADLTSDERALVDWRNTATDLGTAELVDIMKSQYQPSPTDTPETRVLRYRLAAITRATIKGRGAELPPAPSSTRAADRTAVACMIRSSELAQLWRAGDSAELYAEPELAGALDLFIFAERRVGPTPNDEQSAELVALHKELSTKIETGNRPTSAGSRSPRATERAISADHEMDR